MSAAGKQEDMQNHKIAFINNIMMKIKDDLEEDAVKNETRFVEEALRIIQFTVSLTKVPYRIFKLSYLKYLI